jgi:hypothetical protein
MDEASREALSRAFELSARNPQPWGAEAILKVAAEFREFLGSPDSLTERVVWLTEVTEETHRRLLALESDPAPKQTRQRPKSAPSTTETIPPDGTVITPCDISSPVDF